MGFMFLYLAPCFYCDVTEIWISASKLQRMATIIAGIWIELVVCGFAMIVWLNTPAGAWLHDLAYQLILITGIAVVILNLNPLIKLDGYYLLTEVIGIPDLKERSTAFLSGWFQSRVLRLPVETIVIPRTARLAVHSLRDCLGHLQLHAAFLCHSSLIQHFAITGLRSSLSFPPACCLFSCSDRACAPCAM